jgi:hypothetical protein
LDTSQLQQQHLTLKGRLQPVDAWVLPSSIVISSW